MESSSFRIAADRAPVAVALDVLGNRWAALLLWSLFWGGKGFYELLAATEGISRRELADELASLESQGLVAHVRARPGPRVQYVLTALGAGLRPVLAAMYEWGLKARDLPTPERPERVTAWAVGDEHFQAAVDAGTLTTAP
jgi:DNA-binding HxlR family transcriptional regulator